MNPSSPLPPPLHCLLSPRSDEEAFKQSVESITGPISRTISTKGMPAVYEALDAEGKKIFEQVGAARVLAPSVWRV